METGTTITTDRLFLERLSENDNDFILELLNTDGWIKFIGDRNIKTTEDAVAYIQKIKENANITYWTTKLKDTKIAIGVITLIKRENLEYEDIGFAFLPDYSNKGYAFEASMAVLKFLATKKSIFYILAETLPENINSIKLIEKLGLRFEKTIEIDDEILNIYKASAGQFISK